MSTVCPAWCSPAVCEVVGELLPLTGTAHKSRPVEIDLGPFFPRPRRRVAVHLHQAVAPWPVDTFLVVTVAGEEYSLPVAAARALLGQVDALIGRAFPPVDDDRPAAETATQHGSPASAEDDFCPVHRESYCVLWAGESDDQDNVWTCQRTGAEWRTKARRPGNGSEFVMVIPASAEAWELLCFACPGDRSGQGRWLRGRYPTEAAANEAAAAHAAGHESTQDGAR